MPTAHASCEVVVDQTLLFMAFHSVCRKVAPLYSTLADVVDFTCVY